MKHEKKVWPEYFQEILEGKKTFELRLADWQCNEGDTLVLKEWNPQTSQYTGRKLEKKIAYVLKTNDLSFWPKKEIEKYGYQIIAFKWSKKYYKSINKETLESEVALCRSLAKKNQGKCNWGECKKCGVLPLLNKLYSGNVLEDPKKILQFKEEHGVQ